MSETLSLTGTQRSLLVHHEKPPEGFDLVTADVEEDMDSHGCLTMYSIIRRLADGKLFAVPWGRNSEEWFIGDVSDASFDSCYPVVEVVAKEVVQTVYQQADGKNLQNHTW